MKIAVKILPRVEVLDTQGRAVESVLKRSGHPVASVRVGKYIVVDIESESRERALDLAKKMAETTLHNSLIESFDLEVL